MLADMRTEPEPTRPSPLASTGSSRPAEHDGRPSPVGGPITGALRWTVERLAETLVQPEPEERSLTWGTDAGGDRVAYRSWLSEIARRKEQTAGGDAALPAEGPLLSVLVPVYRPEIWYLNACIESVRGQRYRNWELCLCDDASGDEGVTSVLAAVLLRRPPHQGRRPRYERRDLEGVQFRSRHCQRRVRCHARSRRCP